MDLPIRFKERMLKLLGEEEFKQYEESFQNERMYGLRVNTSKISTEEFERICPFEIQRIPWVRNGYFYDGTKVSPAKHPYYHAGLYYLQEPSAMTPASLLPVEPGDAVLDLCAAPGGKATELGVKLQGRGCLVANDISNSRAKGLLKNLELFGIPNMIVTNETPDKLLGCFEGFFDKILIDAPCSGEGMFRKDPAIMKSWVKKGPEEFAQIQREIVTTAVKMLKPGGVLLYSTCTFAPEENEGTILYLLKENPDLEVQEATWYEGFTSGRPEWLSWTGEAGMFESADNKITCLNSGGEVFGYEEQLKRCIRIFPHKMNGEGHFIALLHKKGDRIAHSDITKQKRKAFENEDFDQFLELLEGDWNKNRFVIYQERVYYMPLGADRVSNPVDGKAKGIHLLRNGLLFGECRKNRFEPSQALAMALSKKQCRQTIDLTRDDVRVIKYLKGETIEVEDVAGDKAAGWHLVCVDGYPLGWGKLIRGTLKNKYHAGWRWM